MKKEEDIFTRAKELHKLVYQEGRRIIDLAKETGLTPSYICHLLRLVKLPSFVIDGYYSKTISLSHLFVISRIKDEKKILKIYEKVLAENLTVSETENLVREVLYQVKATGDYLPKNKLAGYIQKLKSLWNNLEIKIIQTRIRSKIIFEIRGSLDESGMIVEKILNKLTK